jgi:predicted DNA-binding protein YlxM (UPF0122 family)
MLQQSDQNCIKRMKKELLKFQTQLQLIANEGNKPNMFKGSIKLMGECITDFDKKLSKEGNTVSEL